MLIHDPHHAAGCGCTSVLGDAIDTAGHKLNRRDFVKSLAATAVSTTLVASAPADAQTPRVTAEDAGATTIYYGGPIVTMVKDGDRVEAVAVRNGKILKTGTRTDVFATRGAATRMVDLQGRCLMPGFIDPHSHVVMQSAKFATVNLDPKPIGNIGSIADIQNALRKHIAEKKPAPGTWVIGWGYDDTGIAEKRHPTRDDLDAVSTEHPILLMHISSHLMAGNSRLFQEIGVNADTPDPQGGKFQRKPNSKEPNGVMEELAMVAVVKKLPAPTPEQAMAMLEKGLRLYAEAGITTACDGATGAGAAKLLAAMGQSGKLPIDVVSWPLYKGTSDAAFETVASGWNRPGRFRTGGIKLTVDGSIQGYTAFLSQPYFVQPGATAIAPDKCAGESAEHLFVSGDTAPAGSMSPPPAAAHRGFSNMTQDEIETWIRRCDARGVPMQIHTNGDSATDMLVTAIKNVRKDKPRPELRTVIIHAQTIREDQIDFAKAQGLVPSFFPVHVVFWGDRHRDLFLGPERAARISPAKSCVNRNMKFTLHHDAPIAGVEMLPVAAASVNRVTSSGKPLGPEQRITPFEALRAITADAAWQNFEEDRKGTLEVGKLADLVMLSADPLAVDPLKMGEIRVLETIKEGESVYVAKV